MIHGNCHPPAQHHKKHGAETPGQRSTVATTLLDSAALKKSALPRETMALSVLKIVTQGKLSFHLSTPPPPDYHLSQLNMALREHKPYPYYSPPWLGPSMPYHMQWHNWDACSSYSRAYNRPTSSHTSRVKSVGLSPFDSVS